MFGPHEIISRLAADVSSWTAAELAQSLRDLADIRSAVDACEARVLTAFAAARAGGGGSLDVPSWLQAETGISRREAARRAATAQGLARLPVVEQDLARGRITAEHAATLASAARSCPEVSEHATELVALAGSLPADTFSKELRAWVHNRKADGGVNEYERQRARRRVGVFATDDGLVGLDVRLDPVAGATVTGLLDQVAEELWRADSADPAGGTRAREVELPARRADALVEIFRRAAEGGRAATRRARPTVIVLIDHRTLLGQLAEHPICELVDRTPLSAATARRLACDAGILPVVLGGKSMPLDLGRTQRQPSAAQRKALVLRDRGCIFPGCDRPPEVCDAHHLVPYANAGPTDLDNLGLTCWSHHHDLHEGGWQLSRRPDGTVTARGPDGLCLIRTPDGTLSVRSSDGSVLVPGRPETEASSGELELAWAGPPP
jgi:hypothetical protein